MRKPAFCICENKGADQLHVNHAANQRLCFRYIESKVQSLYFRNLKALAIFCGCTVRFVSDLVGNPKDRFSRDADHFRLHSPEHFFDFINFLEIGS